MCHSVCPQSRVAQGREVTQTLHLHFCLYGVMELEQVIGHFVITLEDETGRNTAGVRDSRIQWKISEVKGRKGQGWEKRQWHQVRNQVMASISATRVVRNKHAPITKQAYFLVYSKMNLSISKPQSF